MKLYHFPASMGKQDRSL